MKSEAQNESIVLLCPRNERRRRLLCQSNGGNYFYDLFHLGFYVPQLRYPLTRLLAAASRINTTLTPFHQSVLKERRLDSRLSIWIFSMNGSEQPRNINDGEALVLCFYFTSFIRVRSCESTHSLERGGGGGGQTCNPSGTLDTALECL